MQLTFQQLKFHSYYIYIRISAVRMCVRLCQLRGHQKLVFNHDTKKISVNFQTILFNIIYAQIYLDATSGSPPTLPAKALAPNYLFDFHCR